MHGKQVGVVSWGNGCADPAYPGVYSRISAAYSTFIGPFIATWSNPMTSPPNSYARPITSTTTEHILGCTDLGGFYDIDGVNYNCMWYAGSENGATRCSLYGNDYAHAGLTAKMACCICGGGQKSSITSAPTTRKPTSKPTMITSSKPTTRKPATTVSSKPTTRKPTSKPTQTPTNEPTTESPTTESPTTDSPTTNSPTTDSPTTESPTTDSPTTDSPTTDSPTTESPTTESPTTESPTTDSPTTDSPTTDSPTTESPTTDQPTSKPTTSKPSTPVNT
ncbi:LOW QUALITY PROTEIN: hypothetical protein ACHAXA_011877 [Cyclostephanos tholiformis]|uniref:Peptidase S1 domain-containing protein n=1 Tax=Cyclostephanos tholiformis TaxID=382380 RepID=A0ABD3RK97_9STRA